MRRSGVRLLFPAPYFVGCQFRSAANRLSKSSDTISRARLWVRLRNTRGAISFSCASSHRAAQRHQRSPGCKPGNPNSGLGVERSLPRDRENSRNSRVSRTHTVCDPKSSSLVLQQPSRKKPAFGFSLQVSSASPNTFTARSIARSPKSMVAEFTTWKSVRVLGYSVGSQCPGR